MKYKIAIGVILSVLIFVAIIIAVVIKSIKSSVKDEIKSVIKIVKPIIGKNIQSVRNNVMNNTMNNTMNNISNDITNDNTNKYHWNVIKSDNGANYCSLGPWDGYDTLMECLYEENVVDIRPTNSDQEIRYKNMTCLLNDEDVKGLNIDINNTNICTPFLVHTNNNDNIKNIIASPFGPNLPEFSNVIDCMNYKQTK
jgi:hypothetical protein